MAIKTNMTYWGEGSPKMYLVCFSIWRGHRHPPRWLVNSLTSFLPSVSN